MKKFWILCGLFFLVGTTLWGQQNFLTYTWNNGEGDNNWANPGNWMGGNDGQYPGNGAAIDRVLIQNGTVIIPAGTHMEWIDQITITGGNVNASAVYIYTSDFNMFGGSLTIDDGRLEDGGGCTGGEVRFIGTGTTLCGITKFNDLYLSNGSTRTSTDPITVSGTYDPGSAVIRAPSVTFFGGDLYSDFKIDGSVIIDGPMWMDINVINITGTLTINAGRTFSVGSYPFTIGAINCNGSLRLYGTASQTVTSGIAGGTGTVTFEGNITGTLAGITSFGNVYITDGTRTSTNPITVSGHFALETEAPTLNVPSVTMTGSGKNLTIEIATHLNGAMIIDGNITTVYDTTITGPLTVNGTLASADNNLSATTITNNGTMYFNGTATQTVTPSTIDGTGYVEFSSTGGTTLAGITGFHHVEIVGNRTSPNPITVSGTLQQYGTLTVVPSLTMTGTGRIDSADHIIGDVIIDGNITTGSDPYITGELIINPGQTFYLNDYGLSATTITDNGTLVVRGDSGQTVTVTTPPQTVGGTGTVRFESSNPLWGTTLAGLTTFPNLTIINGNRTTTDAITVTGNCIQSGSLNVTSLTLNGPGTRQIALNDVTVTDAVYTYGSIRAMSDTSIIGRLVISGTLDLYDFSLNATTITHSGTLRLVGDVSQAISPASTSWQGTVEFYDNGTTLCGMTSFDTLRILGGIRTSTNPVGVSRDFDHGGGSLTVPSLTMTGGDFLSDPNIIGSVIIDGDIYTDVNSMQITGTLTIRPSSSLDMRNSPFTIGSITNNGELRLYGTTNQTVASPMLSGTGSVVFEGNGTTLAGLTGFNNILDIRNGIRTSTSAVTVSNDFYQDGGTLTVPSLTMTGNGTFYEKINIIGTVYIDGSIVADANSVDITGELIINAGRNLSVWNSLDISATTITNNGNLYLDGDSSQTVTVTTPPQTVGGTGWVIFNGGTTLAGLTGFTNVRLVDSNNRVSPDEITVTDSLIQDDGTLTVKSLTMDGYAVLSATTITVTDQIDLYGSYDIKGNFIGPMNIRGSMNLFDDVDITGTLTIDLGWNLDLYNCSLSATTIINNGILRMDGRTGQTVTTTAPAQTVGGTGEVVFEGDYPTLAGLTHFSRLTLDGGDRVSPNAITVSGDLYYNDTSTLTVPSLTMTGANGTIGSNNRPVEITGAVIIDGTTTVDGTNIQITGPLTINAGRKFDLYNYNLSATTITNNGEFHLEGTATQTVTPLTISGGTGKVVFYGVGTTLAGITSFYDVTIQDGIRTSPGALTVSRNFIQDGGTLTVVPSLTMTGTGIMQASDIIGSVIIDGSIMAAGDIAITGPLTINPGRSFNLQGLNLSATTITINGTLNLRGDATQTVTTTTPPQTVSGGGVIVFDGNGTTLAGITDFYNITIQNGNRTVGAISVFGDLDQQSGTLNVTSLTADNGGFIWANRIVGTVDIGHMDLAGTFVGPVNVSSGANVYNTLDITGTLTIDSGAFFDLYWYDLSVTTIINNGELLLSGTATQTVTITTPPQTVDGTVEFLYYSTNPGTTLAGITHFYNLTMTNPATGNWYRTSTDPVIVDGNFYLNSGHLTVPLLTMTGTNKTIRADDGSIEIHGLVTIDGTVDVSTELIVRDTLTINEGCTLDLHTFPLRAVTITDNGLLQLQGDGSQDVVTTTPAKTVGGTGTVRFADLSSDHLSSLSVFPSLIIDDGNRTTTDALTVNGDFTLMSIGTLTAAGLTVSGTSTIDGNSIITTGSSGQTYNGPVTLGAHVTFTGAAGSTVHFGSTVTGEPMTDRALIIATANVQFDGAVGGSIDRVSVDMGTATINADISTVSSQSYCDVALGAVRRTLTAGSWIECTGAVSGTMGLIASASGGLTMNHGGNTLVGTAASPVVLNNSVSDVVDFNTISGSPLYITGQSISSNEDFYVTATNDIIVTTGGIIANNQQTIYLTSTAGTITQDGPLVSENITIIAANGITLDHGSNNIETVIIQKTGGAGAISYTSSRPTATDTLRIVADAPLGGNITITEKTGNISVLTGAGQGMRTTSGDISINTQNSLGASAANAGGVITVNAPLMANNIIITSAEDKDIAINSSVASQRMILKAGTGSHSIGNVSIIGTDNVDTYSNGVEGEAAASIYVLANDFTATGSGIITPGVTGEACLWINNTPTITPGKFAGDRYHIHSRGGHLVYGRGPAPTDGTIPDGTGGFLSHITNPYIYIDSSLGSVPLEYTVESDRNIYIIDVGTSGSPANSRSVEFMIGDGVSAGRTGWIEFRGAYTTSGTLELYAGSGGIRLSDASIDIAGDFDTDGAELVLLPNVGSGSNSNNHITANSIILGGGVTGTSHNLTLHNDVVLTQDTTLAVGSGTVTFSDSVTVSTVSGNFDLTVASGSVAAAGDLAFDCSYIGNAGNLSGTSGKNIEFRWDAHLGRFAYNGSAVVFAGAAGTTHELSHTHTAGDFAAGRTLGRVEIKANNTVFLTSSVYQDSQNQSATPAASDRILLLETDSVLDTSTFSWLMGTETQPAAFAGFYGYLGDVVLADGTTLKVNDFYNTINTGSLNTAPYHRVMLPSTGMAKIEANGNVELQETFVGTLANSTLEMSGSNKTLKVRCDPSGVPQVDMGYFEAHAAGAGTLIASNIRFVERLTIKASAVLTVDGSGYSATTPGPRINMVSDWYQEIGGVFNYKNSIVEFGNRSYNSAPRTFIISGNTTWYDLVCHENKATLKFSNHTAPGTLGHTVNHLFALSPDNSADLITITRETEHADYPNNVHPYMPPDNPTQHFWYFTLYGDARVELDGVIIKYSFSSTRIPIPMGADAGYVEAWPYVLVDTISSSYPAGQGHYAHPESPINCWNVNWFVFNNFFYSFTEDSNRNGRIDRIRLQSAFNLNGDFSDFRIAVRDNDTGKPYTVTGYRRVQENWVYGDDVYDLDSIYVFLQEQSYDDTGATLYWEVASNTSLKDLATEYTIIGNPPPLSSSAQTQDRGTTSDTAPPRISYALAIPEHKEIYFQTSEAVQPSLSSSISSNGINVVSGNEFIIPLTNSYSIDDLASGQEKFTVTGIRDLAKPPLDLHDENSGMTYYFMYPIPKYPQNYNYDDADGGNGTYTFQPYVPVRGIPPDLSTSPPPASWSPPHTWPPDVIPLAQADGYNTSCDFDTGAPVVSPNGVDHRVSDMLISLPPTNDALRQKQYFVWPVWARYKEQATMSDTQRTDASSVIWDFNGTKFLEARDTVLQVRRNALFASPPLPEISLAYNVQWNPVPGFFNTEQFSAPKPADSSSQDLFLYSFTAADGFQSGKTLNFLFRLNSAVPDLFAGRLDILPAAPVPENWYRLVRPFTFGIHDITLQRGGVTILNNVINPNNNETVYIDYRLVKGGQVTIQVFTLDGTMVDVLYRGSRDAGEYRASWNGTNRGGRAVARGMYFIRVVGPDIDEIRKVMVVK